MLFISSANIFQKACMEDFKTDTSLQMEETHQTNSKNVFFAWSETSLTLLKPPRWFRFLVGPEWRRFGVKGFCLGCGWQHTPPQMLSVN